MYRYINERVFTTELIIFARRKQPSFISEKKRIEINVED